MRLKTGREEGKVDGVSDVSEHTQLLEILNPF